MGKTAILVDGGFYRKRANTLFGHKTPEERANELISYCNKHIDYATKDSSNDFFDAMASKRKVALRFGEILESSSSYVLKPEVLKKLFRKEITVDQITESDIHLEIAQKGVDMRIGLDIASLAQKRLVDQIVLIAGDSDFVPAAKHARREGIDFILDPMWQPIKPSLKEHIDGLHTPCKNPNKK